MLEKWMRDPVNCCQMAGVQAPSSVLQRAESIESSISAHTNSSDEKEITVSLIINLMFLYTFLRKF